MNQRKKRNSSKLNLTLSLVFHIGLVVVLFFFAARQGILGKKLKEITVTMAPKEKKPEPPKPPEPKVEPPKPVETPKLAAVAPPPRVETAAAPPPAETPASVAPAAVSLAAFEFNDGAKAVQSASDPNAVYKGIVEHALRARWNRPDDMDDASFVAEVSLSIDAEGKVTSSRWLKGSGNARWDKTVKEALAATPVISRPPPKGFPPTFVTRFDVESERTEDVMHLSSR
ncbi:MAG TPA: TonB family protein [Candidatus Acidoferrum sp.]|jgi:TonB family protein|nr:TonB family protein [Candidatus Acidoferrum sp.]